MTVAELIAELQKLPQDLPVVSDEHCCSGDRCEARATSIKVEEDLHWFEVTGKGWNGKSGKCVTIW